MKHVCVLALGLTLTLRPVAAQQFPQRAGNDHWMLITSSDDTCSQAKGSPSITLGMNRQECVMALIARGAIHSNQHELPYGNLSRSGQPKHDP